MNVVIVGPVHPLRGGIAHHTACLSRALAAAGADVRIVTSRKLYPRRLFPGSTERDVSGRPIDAGHVPVDVELVPWLPHTWARAVARIEALEPDVVVVVWWHSFFLAQTAALLAALRLKGRRTILLCHNIASHDRAVFDEAAWSVLSRLPSAFFVHGRDQAEALRQRVAVPVLQEPHPTYDVFRAIHDEVSHAEHHRCKARVGLRPDDEVMLVFGLGRSYKGLRDALAAAAELARRRPQAVLTVVGEQYERLPPVPDGVRIVIHDHFVPNEDVGCWFAAADVLVAPYAQGQSSHSGVVQIARAFGVPVVATDVEGMRDLVHHEETGLLVPPGAPVELSRAILRVLEDEPLRARLAAAMRASAPAFSWTAVADAVLAFARGGART